MHLRVLALSLVFFISLSPVTFAQTSRSAPSPLPIVTDTPANDTPIRRAEATLVLPCTVRSIATELRAFARYPSFFHRIRSARVIHRDRTQTDVYFQVDLPRSLGTYWFLQHLTVTAQGANRFEMSGISTDGNVGYVETHVFAERLHSPSSPSSRLRVTLLAVPAFPALPATVTAHLRDAVRAATLGLFTACTRATPTTP